MIRAARAVAVAVSLLAAAPALAAKRPLGTGERIDLNRATLGELMRLPGVGEQRARAILERRATRPFRRAEEVLEVRGLGKAWWVRVRDHLVAGPPPATGATAAAPPPARPRAGRQRIPATTRKATSASSIAAP